MRVIVRYDNGPMRAVLTANQEWMDLMVASERNALLRRCAVRALNDWRYTRLAKYFTNAVHQAPFNYAAGRSSHLVSSGQMRHLVINQGRAEARAKTDSSGTQQVTAILRVRYGHPVSKEIARVLRVIPPADVQYFADRFAKYVADEKGQTSAGTSTQENGASKTRKGVTKRVRLGRDQRRRLGVKSRKKGVIHAS